jgi:hypothetical protein
MPLFGYICRTCGKQAGGRRRKWCDECTKKRANELNVGRYRKKAHWTEGRAQKTFACIICGGSFLSFQGKASLCNREECRAAHLAEQGAKAKALTKKNAKFASKADRHRFYLYKRRSTIAERETEPFSAKEIFERDRWTCGICGLSVDKSLEWPHRYSASLDHIIPVSSGGGHIKANVQCSHFQCNMRKNKRLRRAS